MRHDALAIALGALGFAGAVAAHHSGAMFDQDNRVTLSGTVREFQWTNPHCYIQLTVPDAKGNPEEWSLEMAAPIYLQQRGWRPSTLKPGDRITVVAFPLRKMPTRKGGLVFTATDAAGKSIGKPMTNDVPGAAIGRGAAKP